MGNGGIDYVFADNNGRRVYVPRAEILLCRSGQPQIHGTVTNIGGHGVAIEYQDPSRFQQ